MRTRLLLLILAKLTILAKLRSHSTGSTACEFCATTVDSVSATEFVMQLILDGILPQAAPKYAKNHKKTSNRDGDYLRFRKPKRQMYKTARAPRCGENVRSIPLSLARNGNLVSTDTTRLFSDYGGAEPVFSPDID